MKIKGVNASSKKTITLLKKTFAELIEEKKEMNSITVTELVKRAGITRGAFYSHYDNIYQMAAEFQDEILETVFTSDLKINSKEDLDLYLDHLFTYLEKNKSLYEKLLLADEMNVFLKRLEKKIFNAMQPMLQDKTKELTLIFFTDGTIHMILKTFRKEINESLQEVESFIKTMANLLFFQK